MFHLNDLRSLLKEKAQKSQLFYAAIVLILSFVIYQFTLPAFAVRPYPDFWYYGADSYRASMEERWQHSLVTYQVSKHPLYVVCVAQMYRVGRKVYSRIFDAPVSGNLALSFPVAVFGSMNALIAFWAFGVIGFRRWGQALVTALYACSASVWIFSSFPDSYICTTFLTNLFLLAYLKDQEMKRWWLLALLNALACYSAPQQVLLQTIPWGQFLISGMSKPRWGRCLRYSLALTILFLIPYLFYLKWLISSAFPANEIQRYASIFNLGDYQWWISVPVSLFVLSLLSVLPPVAFDPLKLSSFQSEITVWVLLAVIVGYLVMGWKGRQEEWKPIISALLLFCLTYTLFFIWWTPVQAFLFSAPVMLPFWLLAHSGWVTKQHKRVWLLSLALVCVLVFISSARLLWRSRDYDIKYERVGLLKH